jgi:hypothetical protein
MKKRKAGFRILSFFVIFAMFVGTLAVSSGAGIAKKKKKSSLKVTNVRGTLKLNPKKSFKIKTSVKTKKLSFTSKNAAIATVNKKGVIKAGKKTGSTNIIVAFKGGKGPKKSIKVVVTKETLISSIKLNKKYLELTLLSMMTMRIGKKMRNTRKNPSNA